MTTRAQVKIWTRPILAADPRLTLIGSNLVLTPVRHVLRGIYVDRTSMSYWSTLRYYLVPLFDVPTGSLGFRWSGTIPLPRNDAGDFQASFTEACQQTIDGVLDSVSTIADLVFQTTRDDLPPLLGLGGSRLTKHYREHAVALAALGRLGEARQTLAELDPDERSNRWLLESGKDTLAKRANSQLGKGEVKRAEFHLAIIDKLKPLRDLLETEDRQGIGRLLNEWEHDAANRWGVEHLWEPTPFPVELGAGD